MVKQSSLSWQSPASDLMNTALGHVPQNTTDGLFSLNHSDGEVEEKTCSGIFNPSPAAPRDPTKISASAANTDSGYLTVKTSGGHTAAGNYSPGTPVTPATYSCDSIPVVSYTPEQSEQIFAERAAKRKVAEAMVEPVRNSLEYDDDGTDDTDSDASVAKVELKKSYEIGAGAAIKQSIGVDDESLDSYEDEPAGFIYLNYVDIEDALAIIEAGKRKDKANGFMDSMPVGN